ncbi:MAG: hypothetical protein RL757_3188 [Bacteroidota bacterium]|jgi:predicted DCC family thiol-disulfide oxidoreductase YuxK
MKNPIVFFDGVCNLCNGAVQFIIARDAHAKLRFAALQSDAAAQIFKNQHAQHIDFKSIILLENDKIYDRSTAALRIAKNMDGFWKLLYIFIIVPKPIRDAVYNFIAQNRYRWFGQQNECWLPTADLKKRFEIQIP